MEEKSPSGILISGMIHNDMEEIISRAEIVEKELTDMRNRLFGDSPRLAEKIQSAPSPGSPAKSAAFTDVTKDRLMFLNNKLSSVQDLVKELRSFI